MGITQELPLKKLKKHKEEGKKHEMKEGYTFEKAETKKEKKSTFGFKK